MRVERRGSLINTRLVGKLFFVFLCDFSRGRCASPSPGSPGRHGWHGCLVSSARRRLLLSFRLSSGQKIARLGAVSSFWDKIDAVYVVNLDHRTDRWEEFLRDSPVPPEKLHRISAVAGANLPGYGKAPWFTERTGDRARSWAGAAGCLLSHRKVLQTALERGDELFVVLEDDAFFTDSPDAERLLSRWADGAQARNALTYMGFHEIPFFGRLRAREREVGVWELPGVLTTHAYMLHADAARRILRAWPDETGVWEWLARYRAIDTWYREYLTARTGVRVYGVLPCWVVQRPSFSDLGFAVVPGSVAEKRAIPQASSMPLWVLSLLLRPLSLAKSALNSQRTWHRARRGGLPGARKRTQQPQ